MPFISLPTVTGPRFDTESRQYDSLPPMDINDILTTVTLLTSVWVLLNRPGRAWVVKCTVLLITLGTAWYFIPQKAGLIVAGPWLAMYLAPNWLQHWSIRLIHLRKMKAALVTTRLLIWLHPWSGTKVLRHKAQILDCLFRGQLDEGLQLASQLQTYDVSLSQLAEVLRLQQTGDWKSFEDRFDPQSASSLTDSTLLAGRLMATAHLGRWGEFENLCHSVTRLRRLPEQSIGPELRAWAYLGNITAIRLVVQVSGHTISRELREYWLAVAEQMGGQLEVGRERLLKMRSYASPTMLPLVERQLEQGPAASPDAETKRRCEQILLPALHTVESDSRFALLSGRGSFPAMTLTLVIILVGVFLLELPGGSEDIDNLERLGALVVPPYGEPLEWTRRLTCGFLHFGPLHLAMNLLGLWFLGSAVERGWGRWGVLVLFLACLCLSGVLLPPLTLLHPDETAVFAGASGGIMGLLGGLWGNLAAGWWGIRTRRIQSQFFMASSFIVLQSSCDLLIPDVSMTCHLVGLFTGIAIGLVAGMLRCRWMRSRWSDYSGVLEN